MVLERAKSLALANNFVTDLTSLVVVIPSESRNSQTPPATFRSAGSGNGCTGMCVPIDSFNMSSLISPEENSPASGLVERSHSKFMEHFKYKILANDGSRNQCKLKYLDFPCKYREASEARPAK